MGQFFRTAIIRGIHVPQHTEPGPVVFQTQVFFDSPEHGPFLDPN